MNRTITLLSSMDQSLDHVGLPNKAAGYYGLAHCSHTVSIKISDFIGRIYIEASLATKPKDDDWFPIYLVNQPFLQFPLDPMHPTDLHGDTRTLSFTFNANIVWIRARVNRSEYLLINPNVTFVGKVSSIMASF